MRLWVTAVMLMLGISLSAETLWVAQSPAGLDDGTSVENARGVAWLNTATNWSDGTGFVTPGDTVMLSGTIVSNIVIAGSGSNGSPVTIQFSSGARMQSGSWGTGGAISASGKHWINIDGAGFGVIEATNNGTGLAFTNNDRFVAISGCNGWSVQNIAMENMFQRTGGDGDANAFGTALYALNCSSLTLSNCVINQGAKVVLIAYSAGNSNVVIANNRITNCVVGITIGSGGTGATLANADVYGNRIKMGTNWSGCWQISTPCDAWHHVDGVHVYAVHTSSVLSNCRIFGNNIGGDNSWSTAGTGVSTAWIYIEASAGSIPSPWVFNNVLFVDDGSSYGPAVGIIDLKGIASPVVANNTIVGNGIRNGIYLESTTTNATVQNNIIQDVTLAIYDNEIDATIATDYNDIYGCDSIGRIRNTTYNSISDWRTGLGGCPNAGNECSSIVDDPQLTSFVPVYGSPAIGTGTDLSLYFTTDFTGSTRIAPWDIGAYEYLGRRATANTVNVGTLVIAP